MPCVNRAASQLLQCCTEISSFWEKLARSQAQSRLRNKGFCRTCCFHFCLLWKMWQHSLVLSTAKHLWQQKHLSDCCKCKGIWWMCWSENLAIPGYQLLHFSLPESETEQPDNVHPSSKHDGKCTYHDVKCKHIPHFVLFVHLPLCCNSVLLKSSMGLGVSLESRCVTPWRPVEQKLLRRLIGNSTLPVRYWTKLQKFVDSKGKETFNVVGWSNADLLPPCLMNFSFCQFYT